ncbi:MAG: DNA polymerase Y family protein [Propioniciclava sp.]
MRTPDSTPVRDQDRPRTMALWCPDWPVHAVRQSTLGSHLPAGTPVAMVASGAVHSCSAEARAFGVRRGLRLRDAQARCPHLVTLDHDPALDARAFEPVVASVEDTVPGVQTVRPGLCVFRATGAARYLGGEPEVAAVIAEQLIHQGVPESRFGVADGIFAAEQGARRATSGECTVVPPGMDAAFLAPLPVAVLDEPELVDLLRRLGITTLGDLARLPRQDVAARFGVAGMTAHRLARGLDRRGVWARTPTTDHDRVHHFEPPLTRIDQVAFTLRPAAENFIADLTAGQMVCTSLWLEIQDDSGHVSERQWRHPRWFQAADVIDRVRWQLTAEGARAPISAVRMLAEETAAAGRFTETLWGAGSDDRIERAVAKLQSSLGRESVVSLVLSGGRGPADRQTRIVWGDPITPARPADRPWPGQLPPPAPATVYTPPLPADVLGPTGRSVQIDDRGRLSAEPTTFRPGPRGRQPGTSHPVQPESTDGGRRERHPAGAMARRGENRWSRVQAWAGPWPADERWWDPTQAQRVARCQLVAADGSAWLVAVTDATWHIEARYD